MRSWPQRVSKINFLGFMKIIPDLPPALISGDAEASKMTQYWWVNQTRQYKDERDQGLVAGEIREKPGKTHWGRENVKNMKKGDRIVCYRSGVGIDQLAGGSSLFHVGKLNSSFPVRR